MHSPDELRPVPDVDTGGTKKPTTAPADRIQTLKRSLQAARG
jgi:hypothetical protein